MLKQQKDVLRYLRIQKVYLIWNISYNNFKNIFKNKDNITNDLGFILMPFDPGLKTCSVTFSVKGLTTPHFLLSSQVDATATL